MKVYLVVYKNWYSDDKTIGITMDEEEAFEAARQLNITRDTDDYIVKTLEIGNSISWVAHAIAMN